MPTGRRCRTTPLIRGSRAMASNRSPSSLTLRRGRDVNRCHSGRGGSGSAGRSFSSTKMTKAGGAPIDRRTLEISHHRYRNGKRIIPSSRLRGRGSDYLRHLEVLVHLLAEPRRAVLLPDVLVIGHAGKEVVAARGNVGVGSPLLALQRHVALLLVVFEVVEQARHAVSGCVLQRERDEDEPDAKFAEVVPGDRILLVVPLERRRVVEGEPRLWKSLSNLRAKLLSRRALRGWELAPQEIGHPAVEVPQPAVDCQLDASFRLGRLSGRDAVGARDDDEVGVSEVIGRGAHHLELADELVGGDQRFPGDVAA